MFKQKFKRGDLVLAGYDFPLMEMGVILSFSKNIYMNEMNEFAKIHIIAQFSASWTPRDLRTHERIGKNKSFPIIRLIGATTDMIEDYYSRA